eukprot:12415098-Heterocapsa_arctica.AAC.1
MLAAALALALVALRVALEPTRRAGVGDVRVRARGRRMLAEADVAQVRDILCARFAAPHAPDGS